LVAHSGRRTQLEVETLELLMTTHFLNSEVPEEMAASASAPRARRSDWTVAARVVSYKRVECAIDSFAHTKVQEWSAYCRSCCKDGELLSLTESGFSVPASLLLTYQQCGISLRQCLYQNPVGIPIEYLGISDL
jgi:hypothetical protein